MDCGHAFCSWWVTPLVGTTVGTVGEFHLLGLPVNLWVVLLKPGVPQDDVPLAKTRDCKECPLGMLLVLQDEVNHLCHLAHFVGCSVNVRHRDGARELLGVDLVSDHEFTVNE